MCKIRKVYSPNASDAVKIILPIMFRFGCLCKHLTNTGNQSYRQTKTESLRKGKEAEANVIKPKQKQIFEKDYSDNIFFVLEMKLHKEDNEQTTRQ